MSRKKPNPEIERQIDLYVNGQLSDSQIDDLWAELIQDEESVNYLKTVASLKHITREELTRSEGGSAVRESGTNWFAAAAAALVLIAGSFGLFHLVSGPEESLEPIAAIELDYYRSVDSAITATDDEAVLRRAIMHANEGNYREAVDIIEEELEQTTDPDTQARLLLSAGAILYNRSMYAEAANLFERVKEIEDGEYLMKERAYWYLGNTYFQLNRLEEARLAFQEAYELNGAYSRVAQSYLRALASR